MCAISGIIGENLNVTDSNINKILYSLKHRGPDFSNFVKLKSAILMHNRLSIIDINNRSNQPFFSKDNNLVIVFNGEIYNYLELKEELKNYYNFKTKSDTEVLLAAYHKWGRSFLDKLQGAFAFCIYDEKKKTAFFARDRFGQKPLFFWQNNNNLYFSSEVKGLLASGYKPSANRALWGRYLINADTDNARETFFKDIIQLLPGEIAEYNDSKLKIQTWYQLSEKISSNNNQVNYKKAKNTILELLYNSIKITSRSDAKTSISLSGGLDSNLLISLFSQKNLIKEFPALYSINFGESFSEKKQTEKSLSYLSKKCTYVEFCPNDFLDQISSLIFSLEGPSGGLMNSGLYKMYKEVSKNNIKVIHDSTGLDEIFGGYELHHLMFLNNLEKNNYDKFNKNINYFLKHWGITEKNIKKKIKNLSRGKSLSIDGYNLTKNIVQKDLLKEFLNLNYEENNTDVKKSLIKYIQNTKIPRNNRLKDRSSMAHGLELRLPFLEHKLVEYGLNLPENFYFLFGRSKSILRESVKGLMDNNIRLAKKISIQTPQTNWLALEPIKSFVDEIINSNSLESRSLFDIKIIKNEWKNFLKGSNQTSFFIWQIINTELWFRAFIDNKN